MIITEEQIVEMHRLSSNGLSTRQIARAIGCGKTTVNKYLLSTDSIAGGQIYEPDTEYTQLKGRRFLFVAAQNNTFVHDDFLSSLLQYSDFNESELHVGTFTYNKNAYNGKSDEETWYDTKIQPYINNSDSFITDSLMWCGSLNILPTAVNPLTGFESYVKSRSGIVPHAKLQLKSLPSGKFEDARMLYTTGCVTQRNYIEQKAGQKASFHHVYSALAVEVDEDGTWFVRQLIAEDETGCFYDLNHRYEPDGVYEVEGHVAAVNWGDMHVEKISQDAVNTGWAEKGNILDTLKPEHQMIHDVFDMHRRNHHNRDNPYHRYEMYCKGTESVYDELKDTTDMMASMKRDFSNLWVVSAITRRH